MQVSREVHYLHQSDIASHWEHLGHSSGLHAFQPNMAEADSKEPDIEKTRGNHQNMLEPGGSENPQACSSVRPGSEMIKTPVARRGSRDSGQKSAAGDGTQGAHDAKHAANNKTQTTTSDGSGNTAPVGIKTDVSPSQATTGKRRRVQHNYRRLSSSGFADENSGKKEKFSNSASESELSMSPTPPKAKPTKSATTSKKTEYLVNGQRGMCEIK